MTAGDGRRGRRSRERNKRRVRLSEGGREGIKRRHTGEIRFSLAIDRLDKHIAHGPPSQSKHPHLPRACVTCLCVSGSSGAREDWSVRLQRRKSKRPNCGKAVVSESQRGANTWLPPPLSRCGIIRKEGRKKKHLKMNQVHVHVCFTTSVCCAVKL